MAEPLTGVGRWSWEGAARRLRVVAPSRSKRRPWWRDSLRRRMLAGGDLVAVAVLAVGLATFGGSAEAGVIALVAAPLWILLAKLQGLYDADHRVLRHLTVDELPRIFMWTSLTVIGTALLVAAVPQFELAGPWALVAWFAFFVSAVATRASMRMLWRRLTPPSRAVIIGSGPLVEATRRKLALFSDIHVDLVGVVPVPTVDNLRSAPPWSAGIDRVILASQLLDERLLEALVAACRAEKLKLSIVPPARGHLTATARLTHLAELPLIDYSTWDVSRSTLLLKRSLDLAVASVALAVLAPLFALAALVVFVRDGRPILFRQRRAGLKGRPFTMLKFRTMIVGAEEQLPVRIEELPDPMFKLAADPRTTRSGRLLRRLSIDELPQLWNVLRGEMSLVGPRPEQVELVERYSPQHRFRLSVKPGLTGPMQVFGRGRLTFEERLAVERDYIENLSLARDFRVLALTIAPVLNGRGAS